MPLSTKQLAELRHDLTSLAHISYDHLTDELLDHYAALTEENMAAGKSFYEASTDAWLAMGDGVGIQRIQERYEWITQHQIKGRHISIRQSYLRWPTVVTTLLVVVLLAYLLLAGLPVHFAKALAGVLTLSPALVLLMACIFYYWKRDSRKRLVWQFIKSRVDGTLIFVGFTYAIGSWSDSDGTFLSIYQVTIMLLFTIGNLYSAVCLAQLTRETFYYKPAI